MLHKPGQHKAGQHLAWSQRNQHVNLKGLVLVQFELGVDSNSSHAYMQQFMQREAIEASTACEGGAAIAVATFLTGNPTFLIHTVCVAIQGARDIASCGLNDRCSLISRTTTAQFLCSVAGQVSQAMNRAESKLNQAAGPAQQPQSSQQQQQQQLDLIHFQELDDHVDDIAERNEKIHQIENDVLMVQAMFRDLNEISTGQSVGIAQVADNIRRTKENVEKALPELEQAERHQKAGACLVM